ncbi:uncharacterized protein BDV14DRAFT_175472 [Aspergillus stella-maris]|uniref:uncharacterized protein n=1 Tax=Aspergillus stella-maris TaxID=1810926 RepID=UPI003CCD39B2
MRISHFARPNPTPRLALSLTVAECFLFLQSGVNKAKKGQLAFPVGRYFCLLPASDLTCSSLTCHDSSPLPPANG